MGMRPAAVRLTARWGRWTGAIAAAAAVAAAGGALVLGVGVPAPATTDSGMRKVTWTTHGHATSDGASDRDCPAMPDTIAVARQGITAFGDEPGDTLVGTYTWEGCFYAKPDGTISASGEAVFAGTVAGCGTGTLRATFTGTISAPEPLTGVRRSHDLGSIVPHSGTGDLHDVSRGHYETSGTVRPDRSVSGPASGRLTC
jgi:hypothetical protein